MYEAGCFDPNPMADGTAAIPEDGFPLTVPNCSHDTHDSFEAIEELSYQHLHNHAEDTAAGAAAVGIDLQQQLAFSVNESATNYDSTCLGDDFHNLHEMPDVDRFYHHHHLHLEDQQQPLQQIDVQNAYQRFDYSSLQNGTYPSTPDLLNLFQLPRCSASSLLSSSSISFSNPIQKAANYQLPLGFSGEVPTGSDHGSGASVLYDPVFRLNLPPQPPIFRDLFQSMPSGYSLPGSISGTLFATGGDAREGGGDVRQFEDGVMEFTREMGYIGKARDGETKHFATERQRRQHLSNKYEALRSLVPNPTKADRASVVADAIGYIKELLRTVHELKLLVEKKRCGRERIKRHKTESDNATGDVDSCNMKPLGDHDQSYNGSVRSSWLQRKSKETEVDVRIIDDEVTIKLVQRKKNCLLLASKVLDELQLDLQHVAGGHIGDFYSFLFNTKIYECSSVYASFIANRLIEVVDKQCAANPPSSSL